MFARYRMLSPFIRGLRLRYAGAIGAMIAATLCLYCVPLITRFTIDSAIAGKPMEAPAWLVHVVQRLGGQSVLAGNLWIAALLIVLFTALAGLFNFLRGRWAAMASESVSRRIRDRLYDHLQHLPCSFHDRAETGDLVQRCTSDVDTARQFLSVQVIEITRALIMVAAAMTIMLALSWRLALVGTVALPVVVAFSFVFFTRIKAAFKLSDEAEGRMTTVLQENLTGIRVVRAFARQDFEADKFAAVNAAFRDRTYRMVRFMAWYWSSSDLLCYVQNGLVLLFGAYWVMGHSITVGTLWAFIAYENMFIWPVRQMGRILTDLGKAQVSMGRLAEILDRPRESAVVSPAASRPDPRRDADAGAQVPAGRCRGEVSFHDLRFFYDAHKPVLNGVTFEVPAGQTVALLGHSGSGKSTLVHLLLRLYEYAEGSIRLDGRELSGLDRNWARSQMGAVMQEPFLYSKTVRENIALGSLGGGQVDEQAVVAAATAACLHETITGFEDGYQTVVGERGVTLSGGQRQRMALARAILKDPPILLLDDALSAVDTETEAMILDALRARRGRATTIVIAHRLSTRMASDRIIVLDGGRVVQSGSHDELLAQDGLYRRLWMIQSDLAEDLDKELTTAK